ncbi:MAG: chloramphenicol phosphotransferase, partial [Candidatus Brocadiaceae bacterium]|nr:chloramphenicol phosphotransferase [Candidatus Brocadiaceae bacterium]
MDDKLKYLVVVDIPGIKEYVFGTDKLVEIRGASTLLKRVNEESIGGFLSHCRNLSTSKVFAGGGSGHFIVEAQKRGDLEDALSKLKTHVLKESRGGFGLVCGFAEYFEDKYDVSLRKALISLEQDKDENPVMTLLMGEQGDKVAYGMNSAIADYAKAGCNVIVDYIAYKKEWLDDLRYKLKGIKTYFVKVAIPLSVIEEREVARATS